MARPGPTDTIMASEDLSLHHLKEYAATACISRYTCAATNLPVSPVRPEPGERVLEAVHTCTRV